MDFCGKSNGFVDFAKRVDRGSDVNFDADSGSCLSWILNEIWIIDLFLVLFGMLMSSSKLFLVRAKLIQVFHWNCSVL